MKKISLILIALLTIGIGRNSWASDADGYTVNTSPSTTDRLMAVDTPAGAWEVNLYPISDVLALIALSAGTVTSTTYGITSPGGTDDIVLPEANTNQAGLLGADKWDEIVANTAKVIDDTAYNEGTWNANLDAPSKNAVRDKIETLPGGHDAVTLHASATTGGMSLSTQEISNRAATNAQTGYATAAQIQAIEANTAKNTNVPIATDPIWDAAGDLIYGTGADTSARLPAGATTEILVGGGAAAPVWTESTGTGAPVRAGDPAFTGFPTGPAAAPDADYELANKKYVDDNIGGVTAKDIVTTAPLTGAEDNVLPGADADLTLAITMLKDIVTTSPLTGGENDVLPGADADITIAIPAATNAIPGHATAAHITALEANTAKNTNVPIATDPIWDAAGDLVYGTGADTSARLAAGATTEILVGGGAAAPVWTESTGTGAPVRAGSPDLLGSPTIETSLDPDAANGATLGSATKEWSDLYIATGGIIYGGDGQAATITENGGGWDFSGGISLGTTGDAADTGTALNMVNGATMCWEDGTEDCITHVNDTGLSVNRLFRAKFIVGGIIQYKDGAADGDVAALDDTTSAGSDGDPLVLTADEMRGTTITNLGASGALYFLLPAAAIGMNVIFNVDVAQDIHLKFPAANDEGYWKDYDDTGFALGATGKDIQCNATIAIGDRLFLQTRQVVSTIEYFVWSDVDACIIEP